ncbi:hypothetical protein D3C80_2080880 [compost metagenome]
MVDVLSIRYRILGEVEGRDHPLLHLSIELAVLNGHVLDQKCQVGVRVRDDIPCDLARLACHSGGMRSKRNDRVCHILL